MAGKGEVRHLVMPVSGPSQRVAEQVILAPALLLGRFLPLPLRGADAEGAPRFQGQLVGGDVLRRAEAAGRVEDAVQRLLPQVVGALRQAEDEVHADVHREGTEQAESRRSAGGVMPAVHPAEDAVIQGLHPHADAVHTGLNQPLDIGGALFHDVLRVHLHRKLAGAARSGFAQEAAQPPENGKRKHRRGASSDIPCIYVVRRCQTGGDLLPAGADLGGDGIDKGVEPAVIPGATFRVEVAVGAETPAEGNVEIDHRKSPNATEARSSRGKTGPCTPPPNKCRSGKRGYRSGRCSARPPCLRSRPRGKRRRPSSGHCT